MIYITGKIYNGMWNYEPPFPRVNIRPLPRVDWVETQVYCEIFDGLHSQTGTYLETPAHLLGEHSYSLAQVALSRIANVPAVVPMRRARRCCARGMRSWSAPIGASIGARPNF